MYAVIRRLAVRLPHICGCCVLVVGTLPAGHGVPGDVWDVTVGAGVGLDCGMFPDVGGFEVLAFGVLAFDALPLLGAEFAVPPVATDAAGTHGAAPAGVDPVGAEVVVGVPGSDVPC